MSLVASNQIEKNRNEVEVSVDGESFKNELKSVYRKQVKKIRVPGFRPGKAPQAVIERMYGKEIFYEDAIKNLYPKALDEAVQEAGLRVVPDKIDLDITAVSDDGFTFKAVVTTYPEVTIDGYKGLEIEKPINYFIDGDINKIDMKWKSTANLIYYNWLNYYVYQVTPYDLK